mmetsp:Transcript_20071/g.19368  ORF Transcript_20071/g.19368 Transcript_20071/m.19368 type:complete len:378 (-) Transcript_20071:12-1145(-)
MNSCRFQDIYLKIFVLFISITTSIKLQSSKKDFKFWDINRILSDEPKGFPKDAIKCPYVGDWSYYYRLKGMQTSTDDIMVAFVACFPQLSETVSPFSSSVLSEMKADGMKVNRYIDLGCGVGSTLLLVSNTLRPNLSLGVEAQEQSANLLKRSLAELPEGAPDIDVIHKDLRDLLNTNVLSNVNKENRNLNSVKDEMSVLNDPRGERDHLLYGNCNLITANPPYAALQSGTLCKDAQRRSARFELRGSIDDYLLTAQDLLAADGRFITAFWSRDHVRVKLAVEAAGQLYIHKRFDVLMGATGRDDPHLSIYDIRMQTELPVDTASIDNSQAIDTKAVMTIDITRDPNTGGLNKDYEMIRSLLKCAKRPLKLPKSAVI